MQKKCSRCGCEMGIELRNVVYRSRVKIHNVPVHVCTDCSYSQVLEVIKDDLKKLMNDLGRNPHRQDIGFEQISEFSHLLVMVADQYEETTMSQLMEQHVNDLLDMFLLAQSLGDIHWMGEIRFRLTQLIR